MADVVKVTFEGVEALQEQLSRMVDSLGYDKVEDILYKQAEIMKNALISRAPVGPTGNLKRSPIAKRMPKSRSPVVIAGIDRKIAPHAHLVEFGHAGPHPAPAHPFFRPAWDSTKPQIERNLEEDFRKAIEVSIK